MRNIQLLLGIYIKHSWQVANFFMLWEPRWFNTKFIFFLFFLENVFISWFQVIYYLVVVLVKEQEDEKLNMLFKDYFLMKQF